MTDDLQDLARALVQRAVDQGYDHFDVFLESLRGPQWKQWHVYAHHADDLAPFWKIQDAAQKLLAAYEHNPLGAETVEAARQLAKEFEDTPAMAGKL